MYTFTLNNMVHLLFVHTAFATKNLCKCYGLSWRTVSCCPIIDRFYVFSWIFKRYQLLLKMSFIPDLLVVYIVLQNVYLYQITSKYKKNTGADFLIAIIRHTKNDARHSKVIVIASWNTFARQISCVVSSHCGKRAKCFLKKYFLWQ